MSGHHTVYLPKCTPGWPHVKARTRQARTVLMSSPGVFTLKAALFVLTSSELTKLNSCCFLEDQLISEFGYRSS